MTYYHDKTDGQKHLRHWLSIAHQMALDICLNQDLWPEKADLRRRRCWKRIWWCLFIRDRTCAIGMRQRPLIRADECQWSALNKDDFELHEPFPSLLLGLDRSEYLFDTSLQRELADICIAQVQLWDQLDAILELRHNASSPRYSKTHETTLILVPRTISSPHQPMEHCKQRLQSWLAQHSDNLIYKCPPTMSYPSQPPVLTVHVCMANLLYHTLQCMLHRPLQQGIESTSPADRISRFTAKSSAATIIFIFEYAQSRQILHLLPGWSVTVLMQAALTFKDFSFEHAGQACRRLQDCIDILEQLKQRHLHAAFGISLLSNFVAARTGKAETFKTGQDPGQSARSHHPSSFAFEGGDEGNTTDVLVFDGYENGLQDLEDLGLCDPGQGSPWFTEFFDQNL